MIEYKVVTLRNYDTVDSADLNVLAREGWRVVTCAYVSGEGIVTILSRGERPPERGWMPSP